MEEKTVKELELENLTLEELILNKSQELECFTLNKKNEVIGANYDGDKYNRNFLFLLLGFSEASFALAITIMIITLNVKTDSMNTWPIFLALAIVSLVLSGFIVFYMNRSQSKWQVRYNEIKKEIEEAKNKIITNKKRIEILKNK